LNLFGGRWRCFYPWVWGIRWSAQLFLLAAVGGLCNADVYLMNDTGDRLAWRRLPEGLAGMRVFHKLVAAHADEPSQFMVGIETDRGLWVDGGRGSGPRSHV